MNLPEQITLISKWATQFGVIVLVLSCAAYTGQTDLRAQAAAPDNSVLAPVSGKASQDSPFTEESIGQAVVSGILISFAAFGLLATYSLFRASRRGDLQSWWQEINSGLIKPLLRRRGKR